MANTKDFVTLGPIQTTSTTSMTGGTVSDGTAEGYSIVVGSYSGKSKDVSAQATFPTGVAISSDGTKIFVATYSGGNFVVQYTLSTPWDVSTATSPYSYGISHVDQPRGLTFKPDGTKMYVAGIGVDTIYEHTLSTAWDLTTASYSNVTYVVGQDSEPLIPVFNEDGSKMFVLGGTNKRIYRYSLSTPWAVSTASYDSVSYLISSAVTSNPSSIRIKPDGTGLYVSAYIPDKIFEYEFGTPWDITSLTYTGNALDFAAQDGTGYSFDWGDSGTKLYLMGNSTDTVYQYTTSLATLTVDVSTGDIFRSTAGQMNKPVKFNLANTVSGRAFSVSFGQSGTTYTVEDIRNMFNTSGTEFMGGNASSDVPLDFWITSAGTRLYWLSYDSFPYLYESTIGTAFDLSTVSATPNTSLQLNLYTSGGPRAFYIRESIGLYVASSDQFVDQFSMSNGNLSTATYSQTYNVGSDTAYGGLWFKPDGTKMYIFNQSYTVREYNLSSAWNVSSGSFVQSKTLSELSTATVSTGLTFDPTGTKMFVCSSYGSNSSGGSSILQYNLSTAWDVSTAVLSARTADLNPSVGNTAPVAVNSNWQIRSIKFINSGRQLVLLVYPPDQGYFNMGLNGKFYKYSATKAYPVVWDPAIKWQDGAAPNDALYGDSLQFSFVSVDGTVYGHRSGIG